MNEHKYVRATLSDDTGEKITLVGYLYPKHVNMTIDGIKCIARGLLYQGSEPQLINSTKGMNIEYLT